MPATPIIRGLVRGGRDRSDPPLLQVPHQGLGQVPGTLARGGGNTEYRTAPTKPVQDCCAAPLEVRRIQQVALVEYEPTLLSRQVPAVGLELAFELAHLPHRIHRVAAQGRHVQQMQQQAGARKVLQKTNAQPGPRGRTLDDPRYVRDDEAASPAQADHAQIGIQGSEGIIGHLRPRTRYGADQARLARIRKTEQPDVREQNELQVEPAALPGCPRRGSARRPVDARLEAGVADTVETALSNQQALTRTQELTDRLPGLRVPHPSTDRNPHQQILAAATGHIAAHAALATLGAESLPVAEIHQGIEIGVRHQKHTTAVPAVAAIRATPGDELLAPEAHATTAAVTGLDADSGLIDELHDLARLRLRPTSRDEAHQGRVQGAEYRLTTAPWQLITDNCPLTSDNCPLGSAQTRLICKDAGPSSQQCWARRNNDQHLDRRLSSTRLCPTYTCPSQPLVSTEVIIREPWSVKESRLRTCCHTPARPTPPKPIAEDAATRTKTQKTPSPDEAFSLGIRKWEDQVVSTLTYLRFLGPLTSNFTLPSANA